jgi:hypothetical protein
MNPSPRSIQIDASSHCQLACPVCPTADGRTRPVLGQGHLKLSDFETLLDRNPEIQHVELSNYGEMFLNPRLAAILEAAYRRKVVVSGNNGVNLNFAREDALEAVVRYRVRALTCSIDGATQAAYAKYRVNGNLDNVLRNIDRILEYKRQQRTGFPLLYWQFVVFGHNQHELEKARLMAAERGMEFVPRLSWDTEHSPLLNPDLVTIQTGLGAASREEFRAKSGVDYTRDICYQLWQAPVVNWDGKLLGCCVNYWGDFGGNVFTDGLAQSAANPRMQQAREMLTGQIPAAPEIPCSTCSQFESLRDSGRWLTESEIASHPERQYIVSLVPVPAGAERFAKIAVIAPGSPAPAAEEMSGRLFRFGVDQAVFCSVPGAGSYSATFDILTPAGWRRAAFPFEVPERPICHELVLDLAGGAAPAHTADALGRRLPVWIR